MLKLAPYRYVCHLTGLRKLIDGNNEFTAGLRLVKKLLREPRPSWSGLNSRVDILLQNHSGIHRAQKPKPLASLRCCPLSSSMGWAEMTWFFVRMR